MTISFPFFNLLPNSFRLPYLPELKVLIPSSRSYRTSIRTQSRTKYPRIMSWYVINLLERRVCPQADIVIWEPVG